MTTKKKKTANVPNLRFPGFEGEWEVVKLKDCSVSLDYGMNAAATFYDGENKYIRITDIDEQSSKYISNSPVSPESELTDHYLVQENDILFARTGASTGKSYLYNVEDGKIYFAGFLIRARIKQTYNAGFVFAQTQTENYNRWIKLMSMRSGQPGINSQEYGGYIITVPSRKEQNKVASFLTLIDERIQTQNKIIEELQSLMEKLGEDIFSQKIRFSGFNEKWIKTLVKEQCVINPKTEPLAREFVYIDLELVVKGELIKESVIKKAEAPSRASRVLNDWDILFQCVRPYQRNNYIYRKKDERQWVASTGYAQVRTHNNPSFIYYLCNQSEFNDQVMRRCTGTSYPAISGNELAEVPISICSREEQDKIAELLSTLDEKITIERQLLARLKAQKDYLLRNLFA